MQRVKESVTTEKSADAIFSMLKEIENAPKWSLLIQSVDKLADGSCNANTRLGPLKFKWETDDAGKKCTLTANILGTSYSAYYTVSVENGKTVITQDLPLNPMSTEEQIKDGIRQECQKMIALV